MNAIQENKLGMYYKVRTFFANNLTAFAINSTAMEDVVENFNVTVDGLGNFEMEATADNTGFAVQKAVNRAAMRDLAIPIAGALKALAIKNGDNKMLRHASITRTDIDTCRDTEAHFICERLRALAVDNGATLIPYGIPAAKITAFGAAITAYHNSIEITGDARAETASAGKQVDIAFEQADELLRALDGFMDAQSLEFPLLYDQYKFDRKIDDNASGTSTPDVTTTVLPGEFKVILTVPYVPSQKFRAKNKSTADIIEWSLSTSLTAFTNAPTTLDPGAISERQSVTLAPEGNNLMFHNPGLNPIEIEVTVVSE